MSLKLRIFIFTFGLAVIPMLVLGWMRITFLESELAKAGLAPEVTAQILKNVRESILVTMLSVSVLASFFAFAFFRMLAGPIETLLEAMRRVRKRDFSVSVPVTSNDELGELAETFNEMTLQLKRHIDELEEADRAKDNFIAILAHELRNPMEPIVTSLEILRLKVGHDPEMARRLKVVERQTGNLSRLLDYLLDVSRLKQGRIVLEKKRIDLRDVLRDSMDAVESLIQNNQQKLNIMMPDHSVTIDGDRVRLNQVMMNLLKNACEHTPSGGGIDLTLKTDNGAALIIVEDKGSGIEQEEMRGIFSLFARGTDGKQKPGGLGVGLYLVKTFTEMHGGAVTAESGGREKGAKFVIRLPIRENSK